MKKFLLTVLLACSALQLRAQDTPTNHLDMTAAVLDFLSRTELCLNSCTNPESTKAAIPQLQQLKQECENLVKMQKNLPEPTVQDYMAVQNHMATFNTIWKSIRSHISRMEEDKLMTPEIRSILLIAEKN